MQILCLISIVCLLVFNLIIEKNSKRKRLLILCLGMVSGTRYSTLSTILYPILCKKSKNVEIIEGTVQKDGSVWSLKSEARRFSEKFVCPQSCESRLKFRGHPIVFFLLAVGIGGI